MKSKNKEKLWSKCEYCGFKEYWLKWCTTHDPVWYNCPKCGKKMLKPGYDPYG
jgi:DNA-directed RNA polymerase subunit RPC12/RpoP